MHGSKKFSESWKDTIYSEQKSYDGAFQSWYLPLKKQCEKFVCFDIHWNQILYGKEIMNKKFIEIVKKEKPDYILLGIVQMNFI